MIWHLAWTVVVAVAAGALALRGAGLTESELAALGAVVAAGAMGSLLAEVAWETGAPLAILIWALAGAAACLLTGGTSGPLAPWCVAPLAAGAVFGRPRLLALGAAAGVAAAAVGAMGAAFLILPKPPEEPLGLAQPVGARHARRRIGGRSRGAAGQGAGRKPERTGNRA